MGPERIREISLVFPSAYRPAAICQSSTLPLLAKTQQLKQWTLQALIFCMLTETGAQVHAQHIAKSSNPKANRDPGARASS